MVRGNSRSKSCQRSARWLDASSTMLSKAAWLVWSMASSSFKLSNNDLDHHATKSCASLLATCPLCINKDQQAPRGGRRNNLRALQAEAVVRVRKRGKRLGLGGLRAQGAV